MKDLIIKNINDISVSPIERDGNRFIVKPIAAGEDIDTCAVACVEIPPGKYAFGYRYHDRSEEVFYVLSGAGKPRRAYGEKDVKAGEMLCFPSGEGGRTRWPTPRTRLRCS